MLFLSRAKITIRPGKPVRVEGDWARFTPRIRHFFQSLPVSAGTVRYCFGHIRFSRHFDTSLQQRIRNFLINECALKQKK